MVISKDPAAHQLPPSTTAGASATHTGRPTWGSCLKIFLESSQPGATSDAPSPGKDIGAAPQQVADAAASYVYVCGPAAMTAAVHRELAGLVGAGKFTASFHDINYSL
jgi:hypothetical protein